jgi:hypothetical protein
VFRLLTALFAALALAGHACAWGPQAHWLLGEDGAAAGGHADAFRVAVASGALLADLDHALPEGAVIADSPRFLDALEAAGGAGASNRFTAGWRAHVRAQDPGQGEINTRPLKLHADFIVVRTAGQRIPGVVFDAERIRRAATALTGTAPSVREISSAVEELLVFSVVEGALLDMLPIQLDEPLGALPPARTLMPPAMAHHARRLSESLAGTVMALGPGLQVAPEPAPCSDRGLFSDLALPPAALLGLSVSTRRASAGMWRTTVRLARPWMFRTAARLAIDRVGAKLFPTVSSQWNTGLFVEERTRALEKRLEAGARRLEVLYP